MKIFNRMKNLFLLTEWNLSNTDRNIAFFTVIGCIVLAALDIDPFLNICGFVLAIAFTFVTIFAGGDLYEPPFFKLRWHNWRLKNSETALTAWRHCIQRELEEVEEREARIQELEGKRTTTQL